MQKYTFIHPGDTESEFYYIPNVLSREEQISLLDHLQSMNDFVPCGGYKGNIIRKQKWYQKDGKYFCPTWKDRHDRWKSFQYDDTITYIQDTIQDKVRLLLNDDTIEFNSCLINRYDTGKNYICNHRDSLKSFGEYPIIVGLSLGSSRVINFQKVIWNPKNPKSMKIDSDNPIDFSFTLKTGSMFIMKGSSQKYFSHGISPSKTKSIRYSLTIRKFICKNE